MQKSGAIKIVLTICTISILLGTTIVPVVRSEVANDGVPVKLSTSDGKITEKQLSVEDVEKLKALINALQRTPTEYEVYLPIILNELAKVGLIENVGIWEKAILETVRCSSERAQTSDNSLFLNLACFVVGYGSNSHLWTLTMLLSLITLPFGLPLLFYQSLRPRLSIPIGGWLVNDGCMQTLGLLGHQGFSRDGMYPVTPLPSLVLLFGFTGLWISFPLGNSECEFFIGASVSVFGG